MFLINIVFTRKKNPQNFSKHCEETHYLRKRLQVVHKIKMNECINIMVYKEGKEMSFTLHDMNRLSRCCRDTRQILRDAMCKAMRVKLEQTTNKLQDIETSFAGVLGIILAQEQIACAQSGDPFSYTLPVPDYATDHWLRFSFSNTVHGQHRSQDSSKWFISAVRLLRTNSIMPVWNAPEMDVTICKDKSAEYVPCIVQWLHFDETKIPSTWTVLGRNDKIMVRIKRNGEMLNPNRKLPLTIKMI